MLVKIEFIFCLALIGRFVVCIKEENFIVDVILPFRPSHGLKLCVPFRVHIVDDKHLGGHDVVVKNFACFGQVAPAVGEEEHPHGVFVVVGQVRS
jgi:hypothetical protein